MCFFPAGDLHGARHDGGAGFGSLEVVCSGGKRLAGEDKALVVVGDEMRRGLEGKSRRGREGRKK